MMYVCVHTRAHMHEFFMWQSEDLIFGCLSCDLKIE